MRVGFRPGALTLRGIAFDLAWAMTVPRSRRLTYWIGTDVAHTNDEAEVHDIRRRWRRHLAGRSACGAPWFVDELARAGITAEAVRFPYGTVGADPEWIDWPDRFQVSIYLPANKPEFYGSEVLLALADATPDIHYLVFGTAAVADRPNIEHCGYVDDLVHALSRTVAHLRLSEHDAIAGTVRDALSIGRYVLFGYELPGVTMVDVRDPLEIADHLRRIKAQFDAGELEANRQGLDFAAAMEPSRDAAALAEWITRAS